VENRGSVFNDWQYYRIFKEVMEQFFFQCEEAASEVVRPFRALMFLGCVPRPALALGSLRPGLEYRGLSARRFAVADFGESTHEAARSLSGRVAVKAGFRDNIFRVGETRRNAERVFSNQCSVISNQYSAGLWAEGGV
jgi:hypothetical protein